MKNNLRAIIFSVLSLSVHYAHAKLAANEHGPYSIIDRRSIVYTLVTISAVNPAQSRMKEASLYDEKISDVVVADEWSSSNASILTTLAQIMAAALSIAAGALGAFVSLLVSARAAAELKLVELGSEIRSKFNNYDHLWWLSYPDMAISLLEKYKYYFPYESKGKLSWRIFFDLAKKSCDLAGIDLSEIVKMDNRPMFGAMMCHIVELSIDSLDPNSADRRYDVVNFNSEYLATRVYRSVIFPNGVLRFSEWFDRFVAFERMMSMLMHRHDEIIPDISSLRSDWEPDRVQSRLDDMMTLSKSVSPLAYQAEAINKDISRVSSVIQLAKKPKLLWAMLISTIVGVFFPITLLAIKPGGFQTILIYLTLFLTVICLMGPGIGLAKVLRATIPVSDERSVVISELREYFERFGDLSPRDLISGINIPLSYNEIKNVGLDHLAHLLEAYEAAVRSTVQPGEIIAKALRTYFEESKISDDFVSMVDDGAFFLNFEDLVENRAVQVLGSYSDCNVDVWIRYYSRINLSYAKFRLPVVVEARTDLFSRLQNISVALNAMPELITWRNAILHVENSRRLLLDELRKV